MSDSRPSSGRLARPRSALPNAIDSSSESVASPSSPPAPQSPSQPLLPRNLPPLEKPAVGLGTGGSNDPPESSAGGGSHAVQIRPNDWDGEFGLTPEDLGRICNFDNRTSPSQLGILSEYGGVEGVGRLLKTDMEHGLAIIGGAHQNDKPTFKKGKKVSPEDFTVSKSKEDLGPRVNMTAVDKEARERVFGKNITPPPRSDTIFEIVWEAIKDDPIIKVLLVGAIVVLALGTAICPSEGFIEGLAILIAVVIVLSVTAGNDWSKDRKFKKLLLLQSDKRIKVIRGGIKDQISSWDIIVGDLVEVVVGDEIPADGIYVHGSRLVIDESPLTGESVPVKKSANAPFLFSGCQVSEGSGVMLVTGVGSRSSGGQIQELLNAAQSEETVLQAKLKVVAILIGKIGVAAGILTFLGLLIRWAISWANGEVPELGHACLGTGDSQTLARIQLLAEDFVVGITVVVVAVPEGLPLAVTISLAFSMFKMIRDNCFVRHLDASETMGEATCICTDKTGTLTENRMTVVKTLVSGQVYYGEGSGEENSAPYGENTFHPRIRDLLMEAICVNSTCFIKENEKSGLPIFVGSATEGALLVLAGKCGVKYDDVREKCKPVENGSWSFSSDRKRMSTLVAPVAEAPMLGEDGDFTRVGTSKYRLYTKGASEIVLSLCTHIVDSDGERIRPISQNDTSRVQRTIKRWASQGLRTLALGYRDTNHPLVTFESQGKKDDPEHDLVFIGLVGIKDPLRKEVPGAVALCQNAGLTIRMVTGDNILTACKIARECGIMFGDGIALEGPVFRSMSEEERIAVIPRLQVLARSSPGDKHTLVNLLKRLGEVVAVTGDGTNDAPALKEADVGFAMGISGTQIAMNASDIVLLDDNFVSLVQSIRWGRNVLNCVRKFLQFQLAVNIVAIILTFVGSITVGSSPLTTVQLLWVNLIMDSLGALALASDEPEDDILEHPPHARSESLLSRPMREYMIMQVIYQIIILLCLYLRGDAWFTPDTSFFSPGDLTGHPSGRVRTLVFLAFILMQCSNIVMSRQLNGELNFFKSIVRNKLFLIVVTIIIAIQVVITIWGGSFVRTIPLTWREWVICIVAALANFPFVFVCRMLCNLYRNRRERHHWSISSTHARVIKKGAVASTSVQIERTSVVSGDGDPSRPGSIRNRNMRGSIGTEASSIIGVRNSVHSDTGAVPPYAPPAPSNRTPGQQRWQTVRSAVVLIGALGEVRRPEYQRRDRPDPGFMASWIRFRKDHGLPMKGSAASRSQQLRR